MPATYGTEKVSSGPSESESSYYSSSGSGSDSGSGSGSEGSLRESNGASDSCQCAWAIGAYHLHEDSITSGLFIVHNEGCGPITVTDFTLDGGPGPGLLSPSLPQEIAEGDYQLFDFFGEGDIRLINFTVTTDCGPPQTRTWPAGDP